jgi:hypothetical protein
VLPGIVRYQGWKNFRRKFSESQDRLDFHARDFRSVQYHPMRGYQYSG